MKSQEGIRTTIRKILIDFENAKVGLKDTITALLKEIQSSEWHKAVIQAADELRADNKGLIRQNRELMEKLTAKDSVTDDLKPIPLTVELLLKLGNTERSLRFSTEFYVYDRFLFIWKKEYKYWYVVTMDQKEYLTKIEFVHEYQNFILALTGEEIKP